MRSYLQALPLKAEVSIVLFAAFGYPVVSAVLTVLAGKAPHVTESGLRFLLVYEALGLACLGLFLHVRGWTFKRFGLQPRLTDTLIGIGLAVATYAAFVLLWLALATVQMSPTSLGGQGDLIAEHLTLPTVVAVSAVNPVFEELFVCGYVIAVCKEQGRLSLGVNASVAIRLAYHLYQGGVGVIGIIPFGLICAWWYSRTGRLWPVIVAHAGTDLTSLLELVN